MAKFTISFTVPDNKKKDIVDIVADQLGYNDRIMEEEEAIDGITSPLPITKLEYIRQHERNRIKQIYATGKALEASIPAKSSAGDVDFD